MANEINYEDELVKEDARQMKADYQRLLRGQQLLEAEELQRVANQNYEQGIREALKEVGIPLEQWNSVYFGMREAVPDISKALGHKLATKLAKRAAKKAGMARNSKGEWIKASEQAAQSQGGKQGLQGIAEARKQGKLTSEEALNKMIAETLGDFFKNTAGK